MNPLNAIYADEPIDDVLEVLQLNEAKNEYSAPVTHQVTNAFKPAIHPSNFI